MHKIIKTSLVAFLALSINLQAGSNEDKISQLENEIKLLKKSMSEEIDYLHERADENELQSALSKIKFSGELENTVSNYRGESTSFATGVPVQSKFKNDTKFSSKLQLKMNAKITDNLKFTGRLSAYRNWADSTPDRSLQDPTYGRKDGTATLYVERAYVDYTPFKDFIVTIGRQPSTDGPGMNLIQDTPRKSTYPSLLFNGAADGIVASYNFKDTKVLTNSSIRAAYGKGYQNGDTTTLANSKDLHIGGLFFEASLPVKNMGDNLFVLSYVKANNFVGNSIDTNASNFQNLGDGVVSGVYFENNKAFGTNLDYFVSYGHSKLESSGNTYNIGQAVPLLNDTGHALHLGLRYTFAKTLKVGYEYNKGSKNWFSFIAGSIDPLNKLSTRGKVHDFYITKQLDMYQRIRVGYTQINYDYSRSGYHLNVAQPITDTTKRAYVTYNVRF